MLVEQLHPEDIKAAIRKRHGSIREFSRKHGLGPTAVSDLFRGRTSKPTTDAVEALLQLEFEKSIELDHSDGSANAHRLNAGAR